MRDRLQTRLADPQTFPLAYEELKRLLLAEPTLSNYQFAHRLLGTFDGDLSRQPFRRRLRVSLLTSYTADFVLPLLKTELMLSDIGIELYKPHYNQFRQEMLNPESGLYQSNPDVTIVGFNLEDVFPDSMLRFATLAEGERRALSTEILGLYHALAHSFRRHARPGAHLLMQDLVPPFDAYDPLVRGDGSVQEFVQAINMELRGVLRNYPGVHMLDYSRLANGCGTRTWTDPRTYYSARIPVAQSHWITLANYYATHIRAIAGVEVKCLVLDLDNTLWGGVLGEDGFDGILLGETYPGIVFARLQAYLLGLYARGYVLAISSKNNVNDVMDVLRRHPGMVLREHHFAAIKANWQAKEQSIREISEEIQITFDHMLYVDDNPVEIAKVRATIPGISCLLLESPPLDFIHQFEAQRCLGKLLITEEDSQRGRQYFEERQRREFRQTTASLEDFYRSLKQRLTVYVNHRPHTARIAQLTERTNQFNMTTIRLSGSDVAAMMTRPDYLLVTADLSDEFGDSGTIAYLQIRKSARSWAIENWLMSCRVLGRTVEERLLEYVIERARLTEIDTILASHVPTTKNAPFADFYPKNGLVEIEPGQGAEKRYTLRLDGTKPRQAFVELSEGGDN